MPTISTLGKITEQPWEADARRMAMQRAMQGAAWARQDALYGRDLEQRQRDKSDAAELALKLAGMNIDYQKGESAAARADRAEQRKLTLEQNRAFMEALRAAQGSETPEEPLPTTKTNTLPIGELPNPEGGERFQYNAPEDAEGGFTGPRATEQVPMSFNEQAKAYALRQMTRPRRKPTLVMHPGTGQIIPVGGDSGGMDPMQAMALAAQIEDRERIQGERKAKEEETAAERALRLAILKSQGEEFERVKGETKKSREAQPYEDIVADAENYTPAEVKTAKGKVNEIYGRQKYRMGKTIMQTPELAAAVSAIEPLLNKYLDIKEWRKAPQRGTALRQKLNDMIRDYEERGFDTTPLRKRLAAMLSDKSGEFELGALPLIQELAMDLSRT